MHAEQKRQVAVNALLLQDLCCLDALPRGGYLDQYAFARNAGLIVLEDHVVGFRKGLLTVVAQARVDLRRDAVGHNFQNLTAEGDGQSLECLPRDLFLRSSLAALFTSGTQNIIHDRLVRRVLSRVREQCWVGRSVLRPVSPNGIEIAGVRDDGGHRA